MKITIAIACFNKIAETKVAWGALLANTVDKINTELLIIDNNCTDDTMKFLHDFVFPRFPDNKVIHNDDNVGLVQSLEQMYQNMSGDILAILHNDLIIYHRGWDIDVVQLFGSNTRCGMAGFLGAKGSSTNGGRMYVCSNMLEAEYHGARITNQEKVVLFDGMSLICRKKMLDEVGGFDQGYTYHHFYDKDISLSSHYAGWENIMIPVYCHHLSGQTAVSAEYAKWASKVMKVEEGQGDKALYDLSERYYLNKWKERLDVVVS